VYGRLDSSSITCEYRTNPLGINIKSPRVSWKIQSVRRATVQTTYRIQVSANQDNFTETLWDTGVVPSDESIHIEYGGPVLKA
jgi:alpha-L-rhamnosidase